MWQNSRQMLAVAALCAAVAVYQKHEASHRVGQLTLGRSIGIITVGDVYSEFLRAGHPIPLTFSYTFANGEDDQTTATITVAQQDSTGREIITATQLADLPRRPKGQLLIIITLTVDLERKLRLKATVPESGYVREIGPFPVK